VFPRPGIDAHWRHSTKFPGRNRPAESTNFAVKMDLVTLTSAAYAIGMWTKGTFLEDLEAVQVHVEVLTETCALVEVDVQSQVREIVLGKRFATMTLMKAC
jgi:hypothetical protein